MSSRKEESFPSRETLVLQVLGAPEPGQSVRDDVNRFVLLQLPPETEPSA